jgi:preprotein translocase subunit SecA
MRLWGFQSSGVAPLTQKVEPISQDRHIGLIEAFGLTSGISSGLKCNVPAAHFGWLFAVRRLQPAMRALTDEQLAAGWVRIKDRVAKGATLHSVLPEAFALIREISRRAMKEEPFEVQLLTAMGLLDRRVVQLRTGEGKSLAIVMAASLAALEGKGVHVIAESTDSADRDAQRYEPLYRALGLTVGVLKDPERKREAYAAHVTYGFCDDFIFDRLQDATWTDRRKRVQRPPAWAMVDEADNVLLDIARQPVILTELGAEPDRRWAEDLKLADQIVRELRPGVHFETRFENERRLVALTEAGFDVVEAELKKRGRSLPKEGLAHPTQYPFYHALRQSLLANHALREGKHYIGEGLLVNQHNGRAQPLSRFFHGASDAVAIARGQPIENMTKVVGQCSYQDFFATYPQLSGVSGTLEGTHDELRSVYGVQAVEIPTRLPSRLTIEPQEIYINECLDRAASVAKVLDAHHSSDRPVLFPAVTVAQSKLLDARLRDPLLALADVAVSSLGLLLAAGERLEGGAAIMEKWLAADLDAGREDARSEVLALLKSDRPGRERFVEFLEQHGFSAKSLLGPGANPSLINAENGDHLAVYVARAGKKNALTVSTLMGRATDVRPHHDEGLLVICYGHRSSRRDDLQVAGRAGRQGMPGTVQFFSSLDDEALSGLPAKMLRALREQLTSHESLRPTERLRSKVIRAIRRAQDRIGVEAERGRIQRAKLDRVVAEKRLGLDAERIEILERNDLPEVMQSWVQAEVVRRIVLRTMEAEVERFTPAKLEAIAKKELNEAWVLAGPEAARILEEAGVPQLTEDRTAELALETLFEHAGVDVSSRKDLAKTPTGLAMCKATARFAVRHRVEGMSHEELHRRLGGHVDVEAIAQAMEEIGLPAGQTRNAKKEESRKKEKNDLPVPAFLTSCFPEQNAAFEELCAIVDRTIAPLVEAGARGLIEDAPCLTLNERVRDLFLTQLNQIFCDFLEREAAYQENLANLMAFAERDPAVEYWQRASKEFDRMRAAVQQASARAFVEEMVRLAPLAQPKEIPEQVPEEAKKDLEHFFSGLDALSQELDAESAGALVGAATKTAARWFGPLLQPLLERARDFEVGRISKAEMEQATLETRLALLEEAKSWPEEARQVLTNLLSKYVPRIGPSPTQNNPDPETLLARLTIEEMAPHSVRKREAGLRSDGTKQFLEEFLVGRVTKSDHAFIQNAIDRLAREGGAIFALAAQDRERRNWLERHSPPFFVTENGSPYIAIDLTRDGAIEALAHELRHFERWRARRDLLVDMGMPPSLARHKALQIENEPENLIKGETECVGEELRIQREGSDWNISARPTKPEQPGYISRMAYPRIQGLRMYLWNEKHGEKLNVARFREIVRELEKLAAGVRKVREEKLAAATGNDLRVELQRALLSSRAVFDEIFVPSDLDMFKNDGTYDRLMELVHSCGIQGSTSGPSAS